MPESYSSTLVISTLLPSGIESCVNVDEFYYPEEIILFERELVEVEQAAYLGTTAEDEKICMYMNESRRVLNDQSIIDPDPHQMPMAAGMIHFHQIQRCEIEPHL